MNRYKISLLLCDWTLLPLLDSSQSNCVFREPRAFVSRGLDPPGFERGTLKNWVGVCCPLLETLTLFMTKICDFLYPLAFVSLEKDASCVSL